MNQQAFMKMVKPFQDKLYRLAKRLLVSNEEAEDATQEVILKLWNSKNKVSTYKNVEAFAMTMVKNYCFDKLKSKQSNNLKIVHSNYKDKAVNVAQQIEDEDTLNWVKQLINELPNHQQTILQLREIENYEFAQIAEILNMNEATVRVNLSRARKALKEKLIKKHNYGVS